MRFWFLPVVATLAASTAFSQSFTGVKLTGMQMSEALAVSEDGLTILGNTSGVNRTPVIYSISAGTYTPFSLAVNGGAAYFLSGGVSGNGMVAVGTQPIGTFARTPFALYAMTSIFNFDCNDVSTSAQYLVGTNSAGNTLTARWVDIATGTVFDLPPLVVGGGSAAQGISGNGRYVVGGVSDPATPSADLPFRFDMVTQSYQLVSPIGSGSGTAWDTSADGNVVVGSLNGQAFAWNPTTGISMLGFLSGSGASHAFAVSKNGRWVVGMNEFGSLPSRAFIYDLQNPANGMKDLTNLLASQLPPGYVLYSAYDANFDGTVIVGFALSPMGGTEGYFTQ